MIPWQSAVYPSSAQLSDLQGLRSSSSYGTLAGNGPAGAGGGAPTHAACTTPAPCITPDPSSGWFDPPPPALIVPCGSLSPGTATPPAVILAAPESATATASQLFASYGIPTYTIRSSTSACVIFIPPVFIVHQLGGGTFMLTPIIAKIFPGLNVLLRQSIKTKLASVEQILMKFAEGGKKVGFSFGISGNIPRAFRLPPLPVNTVALFLNVDFVGQVVIPFSSPAAFESSPLIQILISKALATTKLTDGCPSIGLYTFNQSTNHWQTLSKPIRTPAIDKTGECGFTLQPGHFSKFAVGGVVSR